MHEREICFVDATGAVDGALASEQGATVPDPPDPPRVEETIAVMRHAGSGPHAQRFRALIVVMWRSGLRISEALALAESDLDLDLGGR